MLPQNVRMGTEEAIDLCLEQEYIFICDKCHVYLLTEEMAFNHKKCIKKSLPVSKHVTVPEKHILLQPIQQQLSVVENNENDVATKKYGVFPSTSSTSNQTLVHTNGQCVEVVDDAHCGPDDATSVIELNKQQAYILIDNEVADQLTACEKITIGKQSKLIQTSTPQEALLEIPTTSTFTEEVLDPSNEPTSQCLSSYSIVESCKNEINVLKRKYAELEEKVNIDTAVKMKKLIEERDFYQSLIPIMLKQHEQMWIDFLDAE
ncbi:uncharacterized protein LOC111030635 [Myzus persicae]|uniref:uncharacterized protein LOC111030635 n=1 Tax=Myzus persicae TaxID=13164 RepID=UPI000B938FD7|nr:uncharacterized protein LOC111030635 [Myzus persicae]